MMSFHSTIVEIALEGLCYCHLIILFMNICYKLTLFPVPFEGMHVPVLGSSRSPAVENKKSLFLTAVLLTFDIILLP